MFFDQRPMARLEHARLSARASATFFSICAATYAVNAMDRLVFPAMMRFLNPEYHFTLSEGGFLSTIFLLGLGAGGIGAGYLVDRMSRRGVIVAGIVIYSVFTLLTPLAAGFYSMTIYRTLTGLGEGMQNVALATAIGTYYSGRRAFALGLLQCSLGIGSFLGPMLATWLMSAYGDWRISFFCYGAIGLIGAAAVCAVDKGFTEQKSSTAKTLTAEDHMPDGLWNRNVLCVMTTGVFRAVSFYGLLGLYATYLTESLHFEFASATFALSMFGLGPFLGPIAGFIADRTNPKAFHIAGMAVMAIGGYLMFAVVTSVTGQVVLAFVEGAAGGVIFVNGYALAQRSVRGAMVGRVSGLYYTSTMLPGAISGLLFAQLVGWFGWSIAGEIMVCIMMAVPIVAAAFIDTTALTGLLRKRLPVLATQVKPV